jgi:UDP-N-acetylglucosamine 2-epimerase (non-hydrolysing)
MNKHKKIVVLAGTRPEAIKLAPVIHKLRDMDGLFKTVVCATGQHMEMLSQAFNDFDIIPDHNLEVMQPGQTLANVSSRLFTAIDTILEFEKPDWLLVQGDTTSVMVGALCAFYKKLKVGHIEAGLRSQNLWAPFPEELNRRVASIIATKHFAPTEGARRNLLNEGVKDTDIIVTGNTVIDALLYILTKVRLEPPELPAKIKSALNNKKRMVMITGHRRENFGFSLEQICIAIRKLSEEFKDTVFVYPVHLNPNVRRPVLSILRKVPGIVLLEPLSYKLFVWLLDKSCLVLTDSGGIQEEAPSLGKPVLVMRSVTERPEGIEAGVSRLVGTDSETIVKEVSALLMQKRNEFSNIINNPYGDGLAAERIVKSLTSDC